MYIVVYKVCDIPLLGRPMYILSWCVLIIRMFLFVNIQRLFVVVTPDSSWIDSIGNLMDENATLETCMATGQLYEARLVPVFFSNCTLIHDITYSLLVLLANPLTVVRAIVL